MNYLQASDHRAKLFADLRCANISMEGRAWVSFFYRRKQQTGHFCPVRQHL